MAADRKRTAGQAYEAFAAGDRSFYEAHLSDEFTFSSPPDPMLDREGYFDRCWPGAGQGQKFEIIRMVDLMIANHIVPVILTYTYRTDAAFNLLVDRYNTALIQYAQTKKLPKHNHGAEKNN